MVSVVVDNIAAGILPTADLPTKNLICLCPRGGMIAARIVIHGRFPPLSYSTKIPRNIVKENCQYVRANADRIPADIRREVLTEQIEK